MHLPSLQFVLGAAAGAARRFPLVLSAALVAAAAAVLLIGPQEGDSALGRLLMTGALGIPFLLALALVAERWPRSRGLLLQGLGAAALVAYGLTLPARTEGAPMIRFLLFAIAAHLAVVSLPLLRLPGENAFWQFGKALFLRLLAGLVFSAVLMLGLSIALLALNKLFGVPMPETVYPRLFMLIIFVFNTWYFLVGVPRAPAALEALADYPPVLRLFAQYILAPLVGIYLALLTAYLAKVLLTTQWPSGWIGWLVSSVGAAGLASLALLQPLALAGKQRWVSVYARVYFILLLPAVAMLLLSAGKRVGQYGLTEPRYILIVLGLWLGVTAAFGALGRLRSLRPLPFSLGLIALAVSAGPWGAFSLSRASQLGRLEQLLTAGGMLAESRLAPAPAAVAPETQRELSAILYYLFDRHGAAVLDRYASPELRSQIAAELAAGQPNRVDGGTLSRVVMAHLGLEFDEGWRQTGGDFRFFQRRRGDEALALGEGAWHVRLSLVGDPQQAGFSAAGSAWTLAPAEGRLALSREGAAVLAFDLAALQGALRGLSHPEAVPAADLSLQAVGGGWRAWLLVEQIAWQEGKPGLTQFDAELLLVPSGEAAPPGVPGPAQEAP
ncbi:DUF4153 domain-containing protein [bacterium]|nr:DUF4153 domain-containing protein [bacterium]